MAFLFVPVNVIAYSDMPPGASNQVSALVNLMRNVAYSDVFWLMGALSLLAIAFLFFAKKTKPGSAALAH
jgi:hypothetical protein